MWINLHKAGGGIFKTLQIPPGEVLWQLVKCLVVLETLSQVSLIWNQCIVSLVWRPAEAFLGHPGHEWRQSAGCPARTQLRCHFNYRIKLTFILVSYLQLHFHSSCHAARVQFLSLTVARSVGLHGWKPASIPLGWGRAPGLCSQAGHSQQARGCLGGFLLLMPKPA